MGLWRGRRHHRRFVALAAGLVILGLPALARGDQARAVGPGPVTGFEVQGDTVEIAALPTARAQVVFHTDDLFRIQMAPDGTFTDPANTPPERDGAPAANVVVKTRLARRRTAGHRRRRLPPPHHPVTDPARLQGSAAVRAVQGRTQR